MRRNRKCVEVYRNRDQKVESRFGPVSEEEAERCRDNTAATLDHEKYSVRIVDAK